MTSSTALLSIMYVPFLNRLASPFSTRLIMRLCTAMPHRLSTPHISRVLMAYAAWLSVYGSGEQQRLAAEFIEYILQRAWEEGDAVYEKAKEIIKEGKERGSLRLEGFEKEVEVDGRRHVVKVIGGGAEFDEGRSGGGGGRRKA
jgi:hypothetical protein